MRRTIDAWALDVAHSLADAGLATDEELSEIRAYLVA
jgi:hypothetical protein